MDIIRHDRRCLDSRQVVIRDAILTQLSKFSKRALIKADAISVLIYKGRAILC